MQVYSLASLPVSHQLLLEFVQGYGQARQVPLQPGNSLVGAGQANKGVREAARCVTEHCPSGTSTPRAPDKAFSGRELSENPSVWSPI